MTRPCPGPLPPQRPAFRLPAGTCDTHAHVLGPYDRFPLHEDRSYTAPESPVAAYTDLLETLGIDRTVIVQPSCYGTDLSAAKDALAQLGERARGVAMVPLDIEVSALDQLDALGFRGVRLAPVLMAGDPIAAAQALAPRIAQLGWHIDLFIDGPANIVDLLPRLAELEVDLVLDHFAHFGAENGVDHPAFGALLELLGTGRTWVKLSSPDRLSATGAPYDDMRPLVHALIEARPDRMLWASDWPHVGHWDQPIPADDGLVDWIARWDVDAATVHRILVDNPALLYDFA